ncbi:MAG: hypothetical protein QNI87_03290 [Erythrobacter sp.]|uniref:glycine zipper domain-containing protein n=1 Tax=Erythrobacter sp. TaxID=1042 RepID=UPI002627D129|nr:hypothetical protein [Erythrobacter sp.]MDJ0977536.1 hypothetical protein [Erythrobacter sp.]
MTQSPSAPSEPRDELRAKIEARERRIAERTLADQAREATETATQYVKQHPLQVVGGAIALGLVIGLLTKPGRRAAGNAASGTAKAVGGVATGAANSVGKAAKKRSRDVGTLLMDSLVAYGIRLIDEILDGTRAGKDALEDLGDSAAAKARSAKRDAQYAAGTAADATRTVTQRTRRRAARAARDLRNRVSG